MIFNKEEIKQKIKEHIADEYRVAPEMLDETVNLFEKGIIDSIAVHGLIIFLERTFEVKFEEKHFFNPSFTSIEGMATIITDIKENQDN
jgi:acyl carrier protein